MATKPKRPRDPNQLAKLIVALSTGETKDTNPDAGKDPAAVALGRKGGQKGGKARAKNLSPSRLSEIGRKGAAARAAKRLLEAPSTSPASDSRPKRQMKKRRALIEVQED